MEEVKISVLTTTCRNIWRQEQVDALKASVFRDFEWIVMDDLYNETKDTLKEMVGDSFPLLHMLAPPSPFFAATEANNLAFTRCRGELVFFMTDYVVPHPDCLARHWELYKIFPMAYFSGRSVEIDPVELAEKGVAKGRDYRMGLFDNAIHQRQWITDPREVFEAFWDGCQNWWAGRNDSAPLEAILQCNGMDMLLSKRHGFHDSDLALRMMILGYRYLVDTRVACLEFPHTRRDKPAQEDNETHEALVKKLDAERMLRKIYRVNPDMDLRAEREKWLQSQS